MNQAFIRRWEQIRTKGRNRYVWIWGVLVGGVSSGVLWSIIMQMSVGGNFWLRLFASLILFPLGGFFWGRWIWQYNEKQYQAWKDLHV